MFAGMEYAYLEYADREFADKEFENNDYGDKYCADTTAKSEDMDMPEDLSAKCKSVSVQTDQWENKYFKIYLMDFLKIIW